MPMVTERHFLIKELLSNLSLVIAEDYKEEDYPEVFTERAGHRTKRPQAATTDESIRRKNEVNAAATPRRELRIIHDQMERQQHIKFLDE